MKRSVVSDLSLPADRNLGVRKQSALYWIGIVKS